MAKTYTLEKSPTTGWWNWECKDGSDWGMSTSKSGAKKEAKAACNAFTIKPPNIDADVKSGRLVSFTFTALDGKVQRFTTRQIQENTFYFLAGLDCFDPTQSSDIDRVIASLKVFGLYEGGRTAEAVMQRHGISRAIYRRLIRKVWRGLSVTVEDNGALTWRLSDGGA